MRTQTHHGRFKRLLAGGVVTGASSLALLGFAAQPALASYKAQVQNGTLQIVGNGASDKLLLQPDLNTEPTAGRRRRGWHDGLQLRCKHVQRDQRSGGRWRRHRPGEQRHGRVWAAHDRRGSG